MPMLSVTPLYAGLITVIYLGLSARVIQNRKTLRISLGDGDDTSTQQRIRAHANLAEYAPLGLLLLAMAELQGMPGWLVHAFGLMLLAGRGLHALGLGGNTQVIWARAAGTVLTLTMLGLTAVANIGHALV